MRRSKIIFKIHEVDFKIKIILRSKIIFPERVQLINWGPTKWGSRSRPIRVPPPSGSQVEIVIIRSLYKNREAVLYQRSEMRASDRRHVRTPTGTNATTIDRAYFTEPYSSGGHLSARLPVRRRRRSRRRRSSVEKITYSGTQRVSLLSGNQRVITLDSR